jgi:hypothetical protein
MGQLDRHLQIANKIAQLLKNHITDPYVRAEVEVRDLVYDQAPSHGITISPEAMSFGLGTADRDDVIYSIQISRVTHSDDDHKDRLKFSQDVRLLFHNKRLVIDGACHAYSTVDPAMIATPEAWRKNKNSYILMRVNVLVRETREREI